MTTTQHQGMVARIIATGFGSGYAPVAPGTFGSLMAIPVIYLFWTSPRWVFLLATVALTLIGVWAASVAEKQFQKKDPSFVVIDEIVGMMVAMLFLPFQLKFVLISFLVFRVMDIIKPWPARKLEEVKGGWGIMLDDVFAGIYTGLCIFLINQWIHMTKGV